MLQPPRHLRKLGRIKLSPLGPLCEQSLVERVETDACANAVADGITDTAAHSCTITVAAATNPTPDAAPYFAPVITVTCPTDTTANTSTAALSANMA